MLHLHTASPAGVLWKGTAYSHRPCLRKGTANSHKPQCVHLQASRDQYCIHPTVSRKPNKDEECNKLVTEESGCSCKYFKNVTRLYPMQTSSALDVSLAEQVPACMLHECILSAKSMSIS